MDIREERGSIALICSTCKVGFTSAGDLQRSHYQSEWHCYNLKRRAAELPTCTMDEFDRKKLLFESEFTQALRNGCAPTIKLFCSVCKKKFQSSCAYDNHVSSKKHQENGAKSFSLNISVSSPIENRQPSDYSVLGNENEVGKTIHATGINENRPEQHLGEGIDQGTHRRSNDDDSDCYDESEAIADDTCLFCLYKSSDMDSNLIHMSELHRFFIPYVEYCADVAGMLEYLGLKIGSGHFCIWCSAEKKRFGSLDACQKHMRDKSHCSIARESDVSALIEYDEFYDFSELISDLEDCQTELSSDGHRMTLPSGATIGHRALLPYYKQYIRPDTAEESPKRPKNMLSRHVYGAYKALGWDGTANLQGIKQLVKGISQMKKQEARQYLRLGIANNKITKKRQKLIQ